MKTDAQIQMDVIEELKWQLLLNANEIGVAVKNGIVTLSGTVDSYRKKLAAEKAAQAIRGVCAVAEEIEVRIKPDVRKSDADLAAAVLHALKWHSSVQHEKIKIKVENGWVTLDGNADWGFQKSAASNAIEDLLGVKGITNNIIVTPQLEIKDVKLQISKAFHRMATLDANRIIINMVNDKVVLSGSVRSFAEVKEAEEAAWKAPGVRSVENNIEISTEVFAV